MLQGLTECETINAGKLREAAEMKNDENILIIEVCYHKTSYKNYTRFLSKPDVYQVMVPSLKHSLQIILQGNH